MKQSQRQTTFWTRTPVIIIATFICGFLCCVVVSLLDKKPSDEVLAIYETATAKGFDEEN